MDELASLSRDCLIVGLCQRQNLIKNTSQFYLHKSKSIRVLANEKLSADVTLELSLGYYLKSIANQLGSDFKTFQKIHLAMYVHVP